MADWWSDSGRMVVKRWSNGGRTVVKRRSDGGQMGPCRAALRAPAVPIVAGGGQMAVKKVVEWRVNGARMVSKRRDRLSESPTPLGP